MSALSTRRHALSGAGRALAAQPVTSLLALLLATTALALPLLLATLALPLRDAWSRLDGPAQAMVFVTPGASTQEIGTLRLRLAELPGVAEARHVPRDAALAELARRTPGALPDLKSNPLPDAIVVTFVRRAPATTVEGSVASLRKLARVDAVQFDGTWYRRWTAGTAAARIVTTLAGALVAVLAVLALLAAAQWPAGTRQDELRVLALVGASAADRRRPFAYTGAAIGLAAGVLACAVAAGALAALAPLAAELDWLVGPASGAASPWPLLPWPMLVGGVAAAGGVGYLGGSLAGRQAVQAANP